jgi:hypothetical protein
MRALFGGLLLGALLATSVARAKAPEAEAPADGPVLERPERHLVLMPVVGLWQHRFNSSRVTAKVGPVWGLHARIEPWSWMSFRAGVLRGNQPVRIKDGALAAAGTDVYQPPLEILRLEARAEPMVAVGAGVSLYGGVGIGWGRSVVPEPTTKHPDLVSLGRAQVYLDYLLSLGVTYEPIVDWLVVGLDLSAGLLGSQSGSSLTSVQAFSPEGHRTNIGGLPKFSQTYSALLGVGIVL